MKKSIWIISGSDSYILTQIISDNLMMLGLIDRLKIIDDINDISRLNNVLSLIEKDENPVLYFIFEDKNLAKECINFSSNQDIPSIDVHELTFTFFQKMISSKVNHEKMSFITESIPDDLLDFAMQTDDGKTSTKLSEADIVIIGISRTTKTPLSLYLTNLGYKVANVPLVPEVKLTQELFKLDKERIFALVMEPKRLLSIRKKRLKTLGLPRDSIYASLERIQQENQYAKGIFHEIGCKIIDVSTLSIEETADIIINTIKEIRKEKR